MAHHCHATGCTTVVPPTMWGCRKHWFMVPKKIRDEIWRTYEDGQCDTLDPSSAYCQAARAAVIAVAEKEGIEPDTSLYDIFETIANARQEQPYNDPREETTTCSHGATDVRDAISKIQRST